MSTVNEGNPPPLPGPSSSGSGSGGEKSQNRRFVVTDVEEEPQLIHHSPPKGSLARKHYQPKSTRTGKTEKKGRFTIIDLIPGSPENKPLVVTSTIDSAAPESSSDPPPSTSSMETTTTSTTSTSTTVNTSLEVNSTTSLDLPPSVPSNKELKEPKKIVLEFPELQLMWQNALKSSEKMLKDLELLSNPTKQNTNPENFIGSNSQTFTDLLSELTQQVHDLKERNRQLKEEKSTLQKRCFQLENRNDSLTQQVQVLTDYTEQLLEEETYLTNHSPPFPPLSNVSSIPPKHVSSLKKKELTDMEQPIKKTTIPESFNPIDSTNSTKTKKNPLDEMLNSQAEQLQQISQKRVSGSSMPPSTTKYSPIPALDFNHRHSAPSVDHASIPSIIGSTSCNLQVRIDPMSINGSKSANSTPLHHPNAFFQFNSSNFSVMQQQGQQQPHVQQHIQHQQCVQPQLQQPMQQQNINAATQHIMYRNRISTTSNIATPSTCMKNTFQYPTNDSSKSSSSSTLSSPSPNFLI